MKQIFIGLLAVFFAACSKEGVEPRISGFEPATLATSSTDVVLDANNRKSLALQLMWNEGQLTSTESIAQGTLKTSLQFSVTASFETIARTVEQISSSRSYTNEQLNNLVMGMGFVPLEKQSLYVRVVSRLANNLDPLYSNIVRIDITPYEATDDGDYLYMANSEFSSFPWRLCSRQENGVYDGFVQVDQWYNFYLANEASADASKIYGSYPLDGNQYVLYAGADRWNCWTSNGGYLYLTADVNQLEWKETVISSLTVTGDFNGWSATANPMTYDKENKVWTASITTTVAEQWGIKILINGSWSWFFGGSEAEGECSLYTSDAGGFTYDKVGTYTLKLDLSDPKAFKYSVE
ncbi:DUF5111 domain-containing protein [Sphingobacterium olei]|uniref:DUF5111 domain-containing protein n=1 Tax=Sphingobacterium olei TaxID=2571155 RepID=A0A4U0P0B0_9SPHI|nr:DUF5111 domain-containing protein [Sphingobacterium olei]TJZ60637.1 DUF5111 domain-containing protein [Sphingobacterium olei]